MKFGVREICDVVLRAKSDIQIGNKGFKKDEPVIYFDTAKTSTLEGAASTVYAQGGKGNSRLIAWEGERTVTFTLEEALISPLGFAILSGAGLIEAGQDAQKINFHMTTQSVGTIGVAGATKTGESVLTVDLTKELPKGGTVLSKGDFKIYGFLLGADGSISSKLEGGKVAGTTVTFTAPSGVTEGNVRVLVDYYVEMASGATQLEITPDKFAGNYYLEASTLFRRQDNGEDMPAQFIVPNVKIQSAFNFAMAASGDPSTFTFTMDAFPDYIKGGDKKVLFALQIIEDFKSASTYDLVGY